MTKHQPTTTAPTRELLAYFDQCHRLTFELPAVIRPGKDAKLLQSIWRSHGDPWVSDGIRRFFEERGPFQERTGYTVGVFVSQFPRLLLELRRAQGRLR